ncbi:sodium/potassium-transporting ATPase subunit beta-1 [Plutella xylostella]|uniref:sodium/potassium-transporting ATPase subunit beta-1 n=1 Tax=Plutella xylostella TaxID=51655 RepID=UPI0020321920|nr:sodium/potassium-transporting ATPase subunit beta-1 [Plutella xylostella]
MSSPGPSTAAPPAPAAPPALAAPAAPRRWFRRRRPKHRVSLPNTDEPPKKKCFSYIYDKQTKKFLGRTWKGWLKIISYSVIYLMFLITYMLFFLYITLLIVKKNGPGYLEKGFLSVFEESGIGLSAVPTALGAYPLISYTEGDAEAYEPYVRSLSRLVGAAPGGPAPRGRRDTRGAELGPCGVPPFGYGKEPCVIVRINKQLGWDPKPLTPESSTFKEAPKEVQDWASRDRKLWLYCSGYYPWDRQHVGVLQYHPRPPGFDPARYPANMTSHAQLIAVQFTKFTLGMSLVVQCKLFSDSGHSAISFVLYVGRNRNNSEAPSASP